MDENEKCISMHQPWASLLVSGIKRIEGRAWSTSYRGRLWIHAAGKFPDRSTIKTMESFYRTTHAFAGIGEFEFPREYPTSAIIGCVDVVHCLRKDEALSWDNLPITMRLEALADFCWLCDLPQKLSVPYAMRGNQGLFDLDPELISALEENLTIKAPPSSKRISRFIPTDLHLRPPSLLPLPAPLLHLIDQVIKCQTAFRNPNLTSLGIKPPPRPKNSTNQSSDSILGSRPSPTQVSGLHVRSCAQIFVPRQLAASGAHAPRQQGTVKQEFCPLLPQSKQMSALNPHAKSFVVIPVPVPSSLEGRPEKESVLGNCWQARTRALGNGSIPQNGNGTVPYHTNIFSLQNRNGTSAHKRNQYILQNGIGTIPQNGNGSILQNGNGTILLYRNGSTVQNTNDPVLQNENSSVKQPRFEAPVDQAPLGFLFPTPKQQEDQPEEPGQQKISDSGSEKNSSFNFVEFGSESEEKWREILGQLKNLQAAQNDKPNQGRSAEGIPFCGTAEQQAVQPSEQGGAQVFSAINGILKCSDWLEIDGTISDFSEKEVGASLELDDSEWPDLATLKRTNKELALRDNAGDVIGAESDVSVLGSGRKDDVSNLSSGRLDDASRGTKFEAGSESSTLSASREGRLGTGPSLHHMERGKGNGIHTMEQIPISYKLVVGSRSKAG